MCPFGFESNDAEEQITHKINCRLNDTRLSLCAQFLKKQKKPVLRWQLRAAQRPSVCEKKKNIMQACMQLSRAALKSCLLLWEGTRRK